MEVGTVSAKKQLSLVLRIGDPVRVLESISSPHAGRVGTLASIDPRDNYGTHLVRFDDGLAFRYCIEELEFASSSPARLAASRLAS